MNTFILSGMWFVRAALWPGGQSEFALVDWNDPEQTQYLIFFIAEINKQIHAKCWQLLCRERKVEASAPWTSNVLQARRFVFLLDKELDNFVS